MLKIKKIKEKIPVYDITVEDNHNFYANDLLVHNCLEITLPTKPLDNIYDGATKRKIKVKKSDIEKYKKYKEVYDIMYRKWLK